MTTNPATDTRSPISQVVAAALDGDHRATRVPRAIRAKWIRSAPPRHPS